MNDFLSGDPGNGGRRPIQERPSSAQRPVSHQGGQGARPPYSTPRPMQGQRQPSAPPRMNDGYRREPSPGARRTVPPAPISPVHTGMPGWMLIAIDIAATAIFLIVFSVFHHVLPRKSMEPVKLPSSTVEESIESAPAAASQPSGTEDIEGAEASGQPSEQPAEPVQTAAGHKFEDKFSDTVTHTDKQYIGKNVNVSVETFDSNGVTYHVADIYVRDVSYVKAAFGQDNFGQTDWVYDMCAKNNGFVAINGDQCGQHNKGVVVRNGVLYRDIPLDDVAVLQTDGTLSTYLKSDFDLNAVKDMAWQIWSFGPVLLTDGQPMTQFNTTVSGNNPRTAIGMIEPLHYLFVTVDGRGDSAGLSMENLSKLMYDLGCVTAYNMDGGGTAAMAVDGKAYSTQSKDRKASDVIYIPMD